MGKLGNVAAVIWDEQSSISTAFWGIKTITLDGYLIDIFSHLKRHWGYRLFHLFKEVIRHISKRGGLFWWILYCFIWFSFLVSLRSVKLQKFHGPVDWKLTLEEIAVRNKDNWPVLVRKHCILDSMKWMTLLQTGKPQHLPVNFWAYVDVEVFLVWLRERK